MVMVVSGTAVTATTEVVLAAGGAAHLVQGIVDVEVTKMVEMLGVAKTVVLPALVIVWPTEQVETLVMTTSVVVLIGTAGDELTGEFGVEAGVEAGTEAPVNGIDFGQLVIKPGFCGTKAAQIPSK
jgi:hypothetical protein